jgi:hypothetical protein
VVVIGILAQGEDWHGADLVKAVPQMLAGRRVGVEVEWVAMWSGQIRSSHFDMPRRRFRLFTTRRNRRTR